MELPSHAERIVISGPKGTVEHAMNPRTGEMLVKDWLDSQSDTVFSSFGVLFERLATFGHIHTIERFRQLDGNVWEFKKRSGERILCYRVGSRTLLTHYMKKAGGGGKCPKREIKKAERIALDHLAWETEQLRTRGKS